MSRVRIFRVGLLVTVVATGASTLAWVPGRTETGIAALQNSGAPVAALADSDGGGPQSAARYASLAGGGAVAGHVV